MTSVTNYIGKDIWIKTTNGDEYSGELFCYDITDSNSFVLRQKLSDSKVSYFWLKTALVREVKAIRPDVDTDSDITSLAAIDSLQMKSTLALLGILLGWVLVKKRKTCLTSYQRPLHVDGPNKISDAMR
jgi:hypothetical protein